MTDFINKYISSIKPHNACYSKYFISYLYRTTNMTDFTNK